MGFHMIYSHSFNERLDHLCVLACLPACLPVRCIASVDVYVHLSMERHEDMTPNFIFHHEFFLVHATDSNTPNIVRLPLIHMLQMLCFFNIFFFFVIFADVLFAVHFEPFNAYEFTFNCLNINNNIGSLPLKNPASQWMVARAYVAYIYYMRCTCVWCLCLSVLLSFFFLSLLCRIFSVR